MILNKKRRKEADFWKFPKMEKSNITFFLSSRTNQFFRQKKGQHQLLPSKLL